MPPTLILIRHAEALHNASKDYHIPDPHLSEKGKHTQCIQLKACLKCEPLYHKIQALIASPAKRTVQTALLALGELLESRLGDMRLELDPEWQETSDMPCDTPSPVKALQSFVNTTFPSASTGSHPKASQYIDYDKLIPPYPYKTGPYVFTEDAILTRGQSCLQKLVNRPEEVIAVVSHFGFLRTAISNCRFANADYRIFDIVDMGEESVGGLEGGKTWAVDEKGMVVGRFVLKEWDETESKGGGMSQSERGLVGIQDGDFPDEEIEGVREEKMVGERE